MYGGLYYGQPAGQGPYAQPQGYFNPPQYGFPNYGPVPAQQPPMYSSNTSMYRFPNVTNSTPMPMGSGPQGPQGRGPGPGPGIGRFPGPFPPGGLNKGPPSNKFPGPPSMPMGPNAPRPPAPPAPPPQNACKPQNAGDDNDDDDDDSDDEDSDDDEETKKKKAEERKKKEEEKKKKEEEQKKSTIPDALSKFKSNPYTKQALHGGASAVGQGLIAGPGGGVLGGFASSLAKGATKCCVIL